MAVFLHFDLSTATRLLEGDKLGLRMSSAFEDEYWRTPHEKVLALLVPWATVGDYVSWLSRVGLDCVVGLGIISFPCMFGKRIGTESKGRTLRIETGTRTLSIRQLRCVLHPLFFWTSPSFTTTLNAPANHWTMSGP